MLGALAAGAVAFVITRAIQSEEGIARKNLSCACHKRIRYWVDDDGNTTEYLAMAGSRPLEDEQDRQPCPVCRRGNF